MKKFISISWFHPARFFIVFISLLSLSSSLIAQERAILDWAKSTRGGGNDPNRASVAATAIDASGNIYTTGYYNYTCDFDPGPGVFNLTPVGGRDIFVYKLNSNGDFVWAISLGEAVDQEAHDIAIDDTGSVYITGDFNSRLMDFDPGPGIFNLDPNSTDVIILKLDTHGNFVWVKMMGGGSTDVAYALDVDASGNVYAVGSNTSTTDFDPGPGVSNLTGGGSFLLKLNSNGDFIAVKSLPKTVSKVDVDNAGNIIVAGLLSATTSFNLQSGTITLTPVGSFDFFIAKILANNSMEWAKSMGGTNGEQIHDLTIDAADNIYTIGEFFGSADFDPGAAAFLLNTNSPSERGAFISKLDTDGNFVLARQLSGTGSLDAFAIAVDGAQNIYTAGRFVSMGDFDPGVGIFNLTGTGNTNAFVSKLNSTGNFVWAAQLTATSDASGSTIHVTSNGIYTTGEFRGTVDFDPSGCLFNIVGDGGYDIFIQKLSTGLGVPPPTITSFTPASGSVGTTVTITGTNFSTTPTDNDVRFFNNQIAAVSASTLTSITTTVPASATTGRISVTRNCITVQSATNFVVTSPTITSFTPTNGQVNTNVTISGTNFSTTAANNTVQFNGITAIVTASTASSITTKVPNGATTGKITVTVAGLTATSATDFTVTTAQNFITQWNLATAGSGATQLTFGTATSGTVNYSWQQVPSGASGSGSWSGATLTLTGLPTGSTIRLQIAPTNFQRIIINIGTDRNRLTQVEQWGSTAWTSMQNAFRGSANLQVTAIDVPNLSNVSDMSGMFGSCSKLNSPSNIGSWNTSVVTNMSSLFSLASAFNQNISLWNTAAVTNMSSQFADAAAFNQDIGVWNTTAVTNMAAMFAGALVFNRNIGAWNTAAVTDMNSMFFSAYVFNQNISGWSTAAVTNMSSMFGYARDFNRNIGSWNTSAVTSMSRMFEDAFDFNQNIGVWNTSAVTNMTGMFIDAYAFNQNIGAWNTAAVTNMSRMFDFATAFDQNIGAWNTAAVTNMSGMFADASAFNQNIGAWILNPSVNLTGMLNNSNMDCSNYSATLIGWSANPSTPNGRTLGATGRQYGINAVAARTNLTATKGWTITGDTPSGAICGAMLVPTITNFTPTSAPIGTTVSITGTNFSTTPANNIVQFNGTTAVVSASTTTSITTSVPTGATTGKISVTVAANTATSSNDFTVTTSGGAVTINVEPLGTSIGGTITKNLVPLITTLNGSLDINSITVTVQPPSGAVASISNGSLTIDYTNISFSGKESITIRACDTNGNCAEQAFEIEVGDDVTIYNAVSPNGDNKNDYLFLQYIDILPVTKTNRVTIFNRWGDEVFSVSDYDNKTKVFIGLTNDGSKLPAGTYFYKIELPLASKSLSGFFDLKY
jgi:gliding motility-associated-like protein